jgi:uncharacterized protein (TIGR02268 family)
VRLPTTPVLVLALLLVGAKAKAQPSPARERRERSITVTGNPADPVPEIHVAKGVTTVLRFKVQMNRDAIEVDGRGTQIMVDVGDSSIILEPLIDLGPTERLVLRVPFADGKTPAQAVFALASSPSEVDTRIDAVRREPAAPTCPAEAHTGVRGPEDFLLLGYMDERGVPTAAIDPGWDDGQGFESLKGVAYRGKGWLMFRIGIRNRRGPQAWVPTEATLTSTAGEKLRGRVVLEEQGERAPGEVVRALVVTEEPPASAGLVFTLEVSGADGRSFAFPPVRFPAPAKERKR